MVIVNLSANAYCRNVCLIIKEVHLKIMIHMVHCSLATRVICSARHIFLLEVALSWRVRPRQIQFALQLQVQSQ